MTTRSVSGADQLRVIYIAGAQHCGSTMLDALLGAVSGARSLGEVGGFHRYVDGARCDCRAPAASCAPCVDVIAALTQGGDLERYAAVAPLPLKERRAHWMIVGTARRREYARLADEVLDAAARSTGAAVLIDSSKNASRAAALAHDSEHDVRVIHLVRDGRSYLASKRRRAEADKRRLLAPLALGTWLLKNLLLWSVLRRRVSADRYLLCRFEDLIADPEGELDRIGRFAGIDTRGLASVAAGSGVERAHLFEPERQLDYRRVRLDPQRAVAASSNRPRWFWAAGGFVSGRWGYMRSPSPAGRRAEAETG